MAPPRPDQHRAEVIAAWQSGQFTWPELAERFGVARATLARWVRRYRESGSPAAAPHGSTQRRAVTPEQLTTLKALITFGRNATHEQVRATFEAVTGIKVSRATMARLVTQIATAGSGRAATPAAGPPGP
jgi:transposase